MLDAYNRTCIKKKKEKDSHDHVGNVNHVICGPTEKKKIDSTDHALLKKLQSPLTSDYVKLG